jgi:hypothetical protein
MLSAPCLEVAHYPICCSVPEVGDIIYVPDFLKKEGDDNNVLSCNKFGGAATVSRVISTGNGIHYITVLEFTGYFEMIWETQLKPLQEDLASKYGFSHAYIKF